MTEARLQKLIEQKKLIPYKDIYNKKSDEEKAAIQKSLAYFDALYELREMRKKEGLTQEQLSHLTGIPRETISKIEAGKRNPTFQTLFQIVSALNFKIKFVKA